MTRKEYLQLFELLDKLQAEAPCCNFRCVGAQQCAYGINGCYGEKCALEVVYKEAGYRFDRTL